MFVENLEQLLFLILLSLAERNLKETDCELIIYGKSLRTKLWKLIGTVDEIRVRYKINLYNHKML